MQETIQLRTTSPSVLNILQLNCKDIKTKHDEIINIMINTNIKVAASPREKNPFFV